LKQGGRMLLQVITIDDDAYELEKDSKSFITEYIFPGGALPSMRIMQKILASTHLTLDSNIDLTDSYVKTLDHWNNNFNAHISELESFGYDDKFQRLWHLYLAYCQAGFAEKRICDYQLLLKK
jgi:cyclopropane-fatty-acyl-phospholipid synthase